MEQQNRAPRREPRKRSEVKVYGLQSCLALAARRMEDVIRVYVTEERLRDLGHVLRQCAADRKAYHVVTPEDLEKVTESRHHEGVCILARQKPIEPLGAFLARVQKGPAKQCLLALEDVSNPHNVGAILRVASHFGVDGVVFLQEELSEKVLSSAVYRTAEGGVEHCSILGCDSPSEGLNDLRRAGFRLVSTSSHARKSLYSTQLPERSVILMGSEAFGLSHAMRKDSDVEIAIPGAGNIESLNVACAAAVCLGEFWRQHCQAPAPTKEPVRFTARV